MEDLLNEYFKFNSNQNPLDIKIIDELHPNKILKRNIPDFIDVNLYKNINNQKLNAKFNIDYSLYNKIIDDDRFGEFIISDYIKLKTIEFVNEFMNKNEMPILPQYTSIIYNIYKTYKLYDELNKEYIFKSGIKQDYGIFLYDLIIKNKFKKILEIGFTNGISGLFLTNALKNLELSGQESYFIAIDPYQSTKWNNLGKLQINKLGYENITVIEKSDNVALPELLEERVKDNATYDKFHLIFIDGLKNFDYRKTNFFNTDLLLKVDGYIIINESKIDEINRFDEYISRNYKIYKKEKYEVDSWIVYKKIKEDTKNLNFFMNYERQ